MMCQCLLFMSCGPRSGWATGDRWTRRREPPRRQVQIVNEVATSKVHGTPMSGVTLLFFLNSYLMYFVCYNPPGYSSKTSAAWIKSAISPAICHL